MTFAQQVAEAIMNEATSGSAVWDELNGPSAVLTKVSPGKYVVLIPAGYDDNGPAEPTCLVTVECGEST